jgi:uncharacterized protein (DUF1499 family)
VKLFLYTVLGIVLIIGIMLAILSIASRKQPELVTEQDGYLHARYETPLMRYIDDVELRLDANHQVIHIRSASRVGQSDLGANRKRVARIRAAFAKQSR